MCGCVNAFLNELLPGSPGGLLQALGWVSKSWRSTSVKSLNQWSWPEMMGVWSLGSWRGKEPSDTPFSEELKVEYAGDLTTNTTWDLGADCDTQASNSGNSGNESTEEGNLVGSGDLGLSNESEVPYLVFPTAEFAWEIPSGKVYMCESWAQKSNLFIRFEWHKIIHGCERDSSKF